MYKKIFSSLVLYIFTNLWWNHYQHETVFLKLCLPLTQSIMHAFTSLGVRKGKYKIKKLTIFLRLPLDMVNNAYFYLFGPQERKYKMKFLPLTFCSIQLWAFLRMNATVSCTYLRHMFLSCSFMLSNGRHQQATH